VTTAHEATPEYTARGGERLTLAQVALRSGYSEDHLARLIR
jgi:hypothetical protein